MNSIGRKPDHTPTGHSKDSSLRRRDFGARFLKQADAFLRIGNVARALDAVKAARDADPSNPYCSAYIERIRQLLLKEEAEDAAEEPHAMKMAAEYYSLGLFELALKEVVEAQLLMADPEHTSGLESEIIDRLIERHMGHTVARAA
ncbi:MAG: hypothetical protein OEM41_06865 [Ignavibacteria bacterium]|nr:hypothetical protein [Ignavibacteria bacterium]